LGGVAGSEQLVDLAGDVALQAADGLASGKALGGAAVQVVAGTLVAAGSGQGDAVEGGEGRFGIPSGSLLANDETTLFQAWQPSQEHICEQRFS
jgi:hypothetical protein